MPPKRTAHGNYNGSISRRSNASTNRTAAIASGRTAATSSDDENPYVGKQCVHEHLADRLSICQGKDLWMPKPERLKSCIDKCSDSRIMHPKVVEMLRKMAQDANIYFDDKLSEHDMMCAEFQHQTENKDDGTKIIRYRLLRFLCRKEMVVTRNIKTPSTVFRSLKKAQKDHDLIPKYGKEFLLILREGVLFGKHSDDERAELAGLVAKCLICCGLLSDDYENLKNISSTAKSKRAANEKQFQVLFAELGIPQPQEMPVTEDKKPAQITVDKKWVQVRTFFHEFFGNRLADPVVNRIYGHFSAVASKFDRNDPYSEKFVILHEHRIVFCWKVCTESEETIAKLKAKNPPASETTTGTSGRSASSDNIAPHFSSKGHNTVNLPPLDAAVASPAEEINPEDLEKARACFSMLERYGDSLPTKKSIEDIHRLIDGEFVEKVDGEAEADGEAEDYLYPGDDPALTEYALKTFSAKVSIPVAKDIDNKYPKKKLCVSLAAHEIHKELNDSKKYLIGAGVSLKEIVAFLLHKPSKPAPNGGTEALCAETEATSSNHNVLHPSSDANLDASSDDDEPAEHDMARACSSILERYGESLNEKSIEDCYQLIIGSFMDKAKEYHPRDDPLTEYSWMTFSENESIPLVKHIDRKYPNENLCVSLAALEIQKELNDREKYNMKDGSAFSLAEIYAFLLHEQSTPVSTDGIPALRDEMTASSLEQSPSTDEYNSQSEVSADCPEYTYERLLMNKFLFDFLLKYANEHCDKEDNEEWYSLDPEVSDIVKRDYHCDNEDNEVSYCLGPEVRDILNKGYHAPKANDRDAMRIAGYDMDETGNAVDPFEKFVFVEYLDSGNYGNNYLAYNTTTGDLVVLKYEIQYWDWVERGFLRSTITHSKVSHIPSVVDLKGYFIPSCDSEMGFDKQKAITKMLPKSENKPAEQILVVTLMGYCNGGRSDEFLNDLHTEEKLDVTCIGQFIYDVADTIDAISATGNVHRDIKLENILIHNDKPVVADFGLARPIVTARDGGTEGIGTRGHKSKAAQKGTYNSKSDIYAFGISLKKCKTIKDFLDEAEKKGDTVARAILDLLNAMTCDNNPISAKECFTQIKKIMGGTIIY